MTSLRRAAAPLLVALLLAGAAAVVVVLAALRADRLQDDGRVTTGTVVAQDARGKSWLAVVEYDADGRTYREQVRIGRWVDPYDGYAVGDRVEVRHDPDDPADLRTARDWNTPGALWASGVVAGCGSALAGVLALVQGRRRT